MSAVERAAEVIRGHAEPTPPGTPDWALWQACALEVEGLLVTDELRDAIEKMVDYNPEAPWDEDEVWAHSDLAEAVEEAYLSRKGQTHV